MTDKKVDVQSPDDAQKASTEVTSQINDSVEKAAAEVAKDRNAELKDLPEDAGPKAKKESFNRTDALLGADEDHAKLVKEAQSQSVGDNPVVVVAPSQNQNNRKHPVADEYSDPHMAKNYLGQPL